MILKTRHGDRARFMFETAPGSRIPTPLEAGGFSWAGRRVTFRDAMGIPAAFSAVRLIAETVGQLELTVVDTATGEPRPQAPQWALLHDRPNALMGPFAVQSLLASGMERGNAFLQKIRDGRQVVELYPLDPRTVTVRVRGGAVTFEVRHPDAPGGMRTLTRTDIIHLPGMLLDDPVVGVSPVEVHANEIGAEIALHEFKGRFFSNDATPGGLIVKGPQDPDQRRELREAWEARHRGSAKAHSMGLLWGDMDYRQIGVNAADAALIEALQYTAQDTARIYRVPLSLINGADGESKNLEAENQRFLQFSLGPRLKRIEDALHLDDDLFPDKQLRPRFDAKVLMRAAIEQRYNAYRLARQGGWVTANEIRSWENLPAVDGGDEIQQTPVGGAPNPDTGAAPQDPAQTTQ